MIYTNLRVVTARRSWLGEDEFTHWGRVTHICVNNINSIGLDNGLATGRRQTIILTNAGMLLTEPLETNFNDISIGIQAILLKEIHLKISPSKCRPFCVALNDLIESPPEYPMIYPFNIVSSEDIRDE